MEDLIAGLAPSIVPDFARLTRRIAGEPKPGKPDEGTRVEARRRHVREAHSQRHRLRHVFPRKPYPGHHVDEQNPLADLQRGLEVLNATLRDLAEGPRIVDPLKP